MANLRSVFSQAGITRAESRDALTWTRGTDDRPASSVNQRRALDQARSYDLGLGAEFAVDGIASDAAAYHGGAEADLLPEAGKERFSPRRKDAKKTSERGDHHRLRRIRRFAGELVLDRASIL